MTHHYESRLYFRVATAELILNQNYLVFVCNLNICSKRVETKFTFWIIIMDIFTSWINIISSTHLYSCVCLESLLSCAHSIAAGPLKSQYINMGNCFGTPPYNRNQYDYEGQQLNYFPIVRHNNLPFPYSYHNTYYPYYHNVVRAQPNTQLLPPCQSFSPAKINSVLGPSGPGPTEGSTFNPCDEVGFVSDMKRASGIKR